MWYNNTQQNTNERRMIEASAPVLTTRKVGFQMAIDIVPQKRCTLCGEIYPATTEFFHLRKPSKDGLHPRCKACRTTGEKLPSGYKRCTKCKGIYPYTVAFFHRDSSNPTGFKYACKECLRKEDRQKRIDHPDKMRIRDKNNYAKYCDRYKALSKKYYWLNRESISQSRKEWRFNNPDKYRLGDTKRNKKRKSKNTPQRKIIGMRYRTRKRNLPSTFSYEDQLNMVNYWKGHCCYCGVLIDGIIENDHLIPLSSNECPGTTPGNIVPACRSCNASKLNREITSWLERRFGTHEAPKILSKINAYFKWIKTHNEGDNHD